MKKTLFALAAAATIAAGTLSAPTSADARNRGNAIGLGLLGLGVGIAAGAAIASHPGYYAYEYDRPAPVRCDGYWARRPVYDRFGNQIGWSRPRWFCR